MRPTTAPAVRTFGLIVFVLTMALAWGDREPAPVEAAGPVTAISAGEGHSCAVRDGGAWCWGRNDVGQLGNGETASADAFVPVAVPVPGMASGVTAISAGSGHTCAVKDGGAWCWGYNGGAQLGTSSASVVPVAVAVAGMTSGVTAISAGADFTCVVKDGGAWCWGFNGSGQLGNGGTANSVAPVAVSGMATDVTAIAANFDYACAVRAGGAWCWGYNGTGQLGNGGSPCDDVQIACTRTTPVSVFGLTSGVTSISAGGSHACAVKAGAASCWGDRSQGQLGNGTGVTPCDDVVVLCSSTAPVAVTNMTSGVTALSTGFNASCSVKTAAASCWGWSGYGQLGNGTSTGPQLCQGIIPCSTTPVAVTALTSGVTAISSGFDHGCAIVSGIARCWGANASGQLGIGTGIGPGTCSGEPCSTTPVDVVFASPTASDSDGDGVPNASDNCVSLYNADQRNTDAGNTAANLPGADGIGDACDGEMDGDGYSNDDEREISLVVWVYCGIMRADVDGDGAVSILDLATVAAHFLETVTPATERYNQDADRSISIFDLARMAGAFLGHASDCAAAD